MQLYPTSTLLGIYNLIAGQQRTLIRCRKNFIKVSREQLPHLDLLKFVNDYYGNVPLHLPLETLESNAEGKTTYTK
jgi:hypothetical protein